MMMPVQQVMMMMMSVFHYDVIFHRFPFLCLCDDLMMSCLS